MMNFSCLSFAVLLSVLFLSVSGKAEDRVALVIGVDRYDKLGPDGQLKAAVSDAKLMAQTLWTVEPSFTVIEAIDATREELSGHLETFIARSKNAECALVYFAGHGIEFHGSNYLVPRDGALETSGEDVRRTKERLYYSLLPMQKLLDDLDDTGAGLKLLIVDACRENPFQIDKAGGTRNILSSAAGLGRVTAPGGTMISYSADAGEMANDGVFTAILTQNMALPGVTLMEVFARTRVEVRTISSQLSEQGRGVFHEPAEYSKLDPEALSFAFQTSTSAPKKDLFAENRKTWQSILKSAETADPPAAVVSPSGASMSSTLSTEEIGNAFSSLMKDASRSANHPYKRGEVQDIGGIQMVFCPDCLFLPFFMGSSLDEPGRREDENLTGVKLTAFWIGQYELTQAQWMKVMDENPSLAKGDNLPVHNLSLADALQWCARMNERSGDGAEWRWAVPSEAQWEYACNAGTVTAFAFGDSLDGTQAAFDSTVPYQSSNSMPMAGKVMPGGSYPANPWGIFDMHGNVAEICFDIYTDKREWADSINPVGPVSAALIDGSNSLRVVKGGHYLAPGHQLRSAARAVNFSHYRGQRNGFRPVMVYQPPAEPTEN